MVTGNVSVWIFDYAKIGAPAPGVCDEIDLSPLLPVSFASCTAGRSKPSLEAVNHPRCTAQSCISATLTDSHEIGYSPVCYGVSGLLLASLC